MLRSECLPEMFVWQHMLRLMAATLLKKGFREKSAELSSDSSAFSVLGLAE
jgi:hypothetical protein